MNWLWDNWGLLLALAVCTGILIGLFGRSGRSKQNGG